MAAFRYEVPDDYDGCDTIDNENDDPTSNNNGTMLKNGGNWRQWKPSVLSREPERVYDAVWFPLMDSGDPSSCCFASSSRFVVNEIE